MISFCFGMVTFCITQHWLDMAAFFGILGLTVLWIALQKPDPKERE